MPFVGLSFMEAVSLVGILIALLSLAATIIIPYLLRRRHINPCYCKWSRLLIELDDSELRAVTLSYAGQSIQRLESTRIALWNGGSDAFRGERAVSPIKIVSEGSARILEARVVAQSLQENDFRIADEDGSRERPVEFEYLSPGHFAVIDLLHTGEAAALRVVGALEGAEAGFRELHPDRREAIALFAGGAIAGAIGVTGVELVTPTWRAASIAALLAISALLSWWAGEQATQLPKSLWGYAAAPNRDDWETRDDETAQAQTAAEAT